ncbi:dethiobiotin synthase [Clostridium sp. FP2]|uniref:dethiobiotin synthase n=1 Tax=Clostridium TaxID=1485 RepID=UPI0013E97600|nr:MULTISPECIES: dethiobiotin synthase [Clostridium]MBU3128816.1 dethiobiotin synthase [Clostridium tagluense]MBW9157181.1 dethiobiotin synthase [Clostridium tagluense]MBZ9623039.1 dethiobiotin synthase [Clostridium sp. FP2]WLC67215.1 dethiobiotin synthase [Clostridium tagluense]
MAKGIFIVGTDTDVGKTVVTAGIIHVLRSNGYNATYFKAALSGAIKVGNELIPGDALVACDVSNLEEDYVNITPYVYKNAVSPHLAAKLENKSIEIDVIREKYDYLKKKYDYIIAEGSGGIICPLIDDERGLYTLENLIVDLNMSVIIVARAGVGTINHTVLTVKYIESLGIKIKGIIINNYIENVICNDNINMIEKLTKVTIIGKFKRIENLKENMVQAIRINAEAAFSAKTIEECMDKL